MFFPSAPCADAVAVCAQGCGEGRGYGEWIRAFWQIGMLMIKALLP